LGFLYSTQGKLAEAEEMYQWALNGYKKASGPEHTSTLNTANYLGLLYSTQGKLAKDSIEGLRRVFIYKQVAIRRTV
jgi:hypothetical protein